MHGLRRLRLEYTGVVVAASVIWVPEVITAALLEDHLNDALVKPEEEEEDGRRDPLR